MKPRDRFLFHVTYHGRLGAIARRGLTPGSARAIGGPALDAHSRGRVFLTDADGLRFWHSRAEEHAEHNSDTPLDDGLVPVVLRVDRKGMGGELEDDPQGSDDASADAFLYSERIEPARLEVWNPAGEEWTPLSQLEGTDFPAADEGGERREEDGEELQFLRDASESPFMPPEDERFTVYED